MTDIALRLLIFGGVLLVAGLLFVVGQLVLGWRGEGGLRLIIFAVGGLMGSLGTVIAYYNWPGASAQGVGGILLLILGAVFIMVGLTMLFVAIAGSNERVRSWFDAVWRGINGPF